MAIDLNYGTLQKQIADELGDRQDLLQPLSESGLSLSPIQNAIQQAITKWERERFYFNDQQIKTALNQPSYLWNTQLGQEYYGDNTTPQAWINPKVSSVAAVKAMWVLVNQNRYDITPRTSQYLARTSVNPAVVGYPTDVSYAAQQFRFYPIPDGNYPVGAIITQRFDTLVNDADQNPWTEDGYDLIRTEAKLILGREILNDEEIASNAMRAIYGDPELPSARGYYYALKAETTRRTGRSRVTPTHF